MSGEIAVNSISRYWERTDQFVRSRLQGRRLGHLLAGQRAVSRSNPLGHAGPAGQLAQQRGEALYGKTVRRLMRGFLGLGRGGGLGRQNRIRGVATHEVRSRRNRPVIWRKRRKDRRELPESLTVLRDTRLERSTMNRSTSATVARLTPLPRDRKWPRKAFAVLRSRPNVASATSQWERRC